MARTGGFDIMDVNNGFDMLKFDMTKEKEEVMNKDYTFYLS